MSNFTEALNDARRLLVGVQHNLLLGLRVWRRCVLSSFASRILEVEPLLVLPGLVRGPQPNVRRDHVVAPVTQNQPWSFRSRQRLFGRRGSKVAYGGRPVGHAAPRVARSQLDLRKLHKKLYKKLDYHSLYNFLYNSLNTFLKIFVSQAHSLNSESQLFPPLSADRPGFRNLSCSVDAALPSHRKSGACHPRARWPRSRTSWRPSSNLCPDKFFLEICHFAHTRVSVPPLSLKKDLVLWTTFHGSAHNTSL